MTEWSGATVLETSRLLLRTFRPDDLPRYAAMNADPQVMEFLGGPIPAAESDSIAAWAQDLHVREGIGLLAVERRADGEFLGMCGLHHLGWFPEDIELGWRLARAHWGLGYATEAATAWLRHGFTALDLPRVISVTDPPNVRSIAVMQRLGMVQVGEAVVDENGEDFAVVIHAVTAEQWSATQV